MFFFFILLCDDINSAVCVTTPCRAAFVIYQEVLLFENKKKLITQGDYFCCCLHKRFMSFLWVLYVIFSYVAFETLNSDSVVVTSYGTTAADVSGRQQHVRTTIYRWYVRRAPTVRRADTLFLTSRCVSGVPAWDWRSCGRGI